jgi:hypothetical protein
VARGRGSCTSFGDNNWPESGATHSLVRRLGSEATDFGMGPDHHTASEQDRLFFLIVSEMIENREYLDS